MYSLLFECILALDEVVGQGMFIARTTTPAPQSTGDMLQPSGTMTKRGSNALTPPRVNARTTVRLA